jgi:hypothetical protein
LPPTGRAISFLLIKIQGVSVTGVDKVTVVAMGSLTKRDHKMSLRIIDALNISRRVHEAIRVQTHPSHTIN